MHDTLHAAKTGCSGENDDELGLAFSESNRTTASAGAAAMPAPGAAGAAMPAPGAAGSGSAPWDDNHELEEALSSSAAPPNNSSSKAVWMSRSMPMDDTLLSSVAVPAAAADVALAPATAARGWPTDNKLGTGLRLPLATLQGNELQHLPPPPQNAAWRRPLRLLGRDRQLPARLPTWSLPLPIEWTSFIEPHMPVGASLIR